MIACRSWVVGAFSFALSIWKPKINSHTVLWNIFKTTISYSHSNILWWGTKHWKCYIFLKKLKLFAQFNVPLKFFINIIGPIIGLSFLFSFSRISYLVLFHVSPPPFFANKAWSSSKAQQFYFTYLLF